MLYIGAFVQLFCLFCFVFSCFIVQSLERIVILYNNHVYEIIYSIFGVIFHQDIKQVRYTLKPLHLPLDLQLFCFFVCVFPRFII